MIPWSNVRACVRVNVYESAFNCVRLRARLRTDIYFFTLYEESFAWILRARGSVCMFLCARMREVLIACGCVRVSQ